MEDRLHPVRDCNILRLTKHPGFCTRGAEGSAPADQAAEHEPLGGQGMGNGLQEPHTEPSLDGQNGYAQDRHLGAVLQVWSEVFVLLLLRVFTDIK